MIKKDNLLRQINILIDLEKSIIPLADKHISSSLFFSNLKDGHRNSLLERFQNIVISQAKHIDILNGIREEISQGSHDVY